MPKRKVRRCAAAGRPRSALRRGLPSLPPEVLARIFGFMGRADINAARAVCRTWRDAVDGHVPELWLARCNALELLPTAGTGVLRACADETRAQAAEVRCSAGRRRQRAAGLRVARARLAAVYREHYMRWVKHVCVHCEPTDYRAACARCTHPRRFRWIVERAEANKGRSAKIYARSALCTVPPFAPLSLVNTGMLLRFDDVLEYYTLYCPRPEAEIEVKRLRRYNVIMH